MSLSSVWYLLLSVLIFGPKITAGDDLFTANDFVEVAGIHHWQFTVPDDFGADEKMGLTWLVTDRIEDETAIMKSVQSNLSFDGIPAGIKVKLFLWLAVFPTAKDKTPKSLRCCLKYKDPKTKRNRIIRGQLELPSNDGYYMIHGFQGSGGESDGNWLLMLTGCKKYSSCFLNIDFWTDSE